jgi:hypothetical protein
MYSAGQQTQHSQEDADRGCADTLNHGFIDLENHTDHPFRALVVLESVSSEGSS